MKHSLMLLLCACAAFAQAGHWQGAVKMGENKNLPLSVDLAKNAQGAWIGSMSITGSSTVDVPIAVTVMGDTVRFAADLPMRATFEGKLAADGATMTGAAKSADGETTFQLTRSGEANVKQAPESTAIGKEFEGEWEASVEANGRMRKVALRLSNEAGKGKATLIAGEQKMEIPVTTVTVKGKELALDVRMISGDFRGTLQANGEISGEWTEPGSKMPVVFKRVK